MIRTIGREVASNPSVPHDYPSVKLDDPSFNAPIYANLFNDEEGRGLRFDLVTPAEGAHGGRRLIDPLTDAPPRGGASAMSSPQVLVANSRDDEGRLSRRGQSCEGIERADAKRLEMLQIAR